MKSIKGFKGFSKDWKCKDYQFAPGGEYNHTGEVKACNSGFHFCENPLDVFSYYQPGQSVYAEVEGTGEIDKQGDDSKVSCSKLKIGAEISLSAYIKFAIEFLTSKVDNSKKQTLIGNNASNTGDQSAASNTGNRSAASNTGDYSAASNTGDYSAASNTGDQSAASNTGYQSAASNTGDQSAASNTGKQGVASSLGIDGKAKGALGCFLVLAEWKEIDGEWNRISVKSVKVDGKRIKADVWYILKGGKFIEGAK